MAAAKKEPSELGRRILSACDDSRLTPTGLERKLIERSSMGRAAGEWSQGYMSRLVSGQRGGTAIDPFKLQDIADELGIRFEWLALGRGPMREGGEQTPRDQGLAAARTFGAREDAIEYVMTTVEDSSQDARYWMDRALQESDARKRSGASEFPATHRAKIRKKAAQIAEIPEPTPAPPAAAPVGKHRRRA